jgi:uncharacterized protein YndB with AHSA1/START domain
MRDFHGHSEAVIEGSPSAVFSTITDIDRLPEWNRAIERVVERPSELTPGATWVVEMHPSRPLRWKSVSTLQEFDADGLRFSYRTVNADGNPSYALWSWDLTPTTLGVRVSVKWDIYLETLDRRLLAGPIRRRQLRKEVATSLAALAVRVAPSTV